MEDNFFVLILKFWKSKIAFFQTSSFGMDNIIMALLQDFRS